MRLLSSSCLDQSNPIFARWAQLALKRLFVLLIPIFLGVHLGASPNSTTKIQLVISVDWEGFSLDAENLRAFSQFRDDYPQIKIVHFLSAAFYTKADADARDITAKIKSILRQGDEVGLHLHAFRSLVLASGVRYRDDITFDGSSESREIDGDPGHDVSLSQFSTEEIQKIIHKSLQLLSSQGFSKIRSFRAGGWIASPNVLNALYREGIKIDSSAVPVQLLTSVVETHHPIYQINKELWGDRTPLMDQAFSVPVSHGQITEYPNNLALADYVEGDEAYRYFRDILKLNHNQNSTITVHFGFHQETAERYLPRVYHFLNKVDRFLKKTENANLILNSMTLQDLDSQSNHY